MFRVIIAGSRTFTDYAFLKSKMDLLLSKTNQDISILCGKARGADTLGERYAKEKGYKIEYFPADWDKYGKSAGVIRNKKMASSGADALVVFWDGKSKGSLNMISVAKEYGLQIRIYNFKI